MNQLQTQYDNLLNRMHSDQNKEKYKTFKLNPVCIKEYTAISDCISHITSLLDTIPTLSDLKKKDLHIITCKVYLNRLKILLDEYGW